MTPEQRVKKNAYQREWRKANPDKRRAYQNAHYKRNPGPTKDRVRRWYLAHKEEAQAYHAERYKNNRSYADSNANRWRKMNPEKRRSIILKHVYGITLAEWQALFDAQGRVCACCGSDDPKHKKGWHTDHDHATGKVRGILCRPCNQVLSYHTTVESLERAVAYLQRAEK